MAALRAIPVKPAQKTSINDVNVSIKTLENQASKNALEVSTKMEIVNQRQKELLDLQKQKNMKQQMKFKEKEQEYIQ